MNIYFKYATGPLRRTKPIAEEIQDGSWASGARQPIVCCKIHATYGFYYIIRYRRRRARSLVVHQKMPLNCRLRRWWDSTLWPAVRILFGRLAIKECRSE
ncbi:hypothetical protein ElyMa_003356900 [Elysia marginata]|uniref:Uncharacterized protein n=1 Tax=Elysia marginata TaxID=1093978 RepID=A0AAV4JNK9_9GAST|nr:hypothetical protein ElyMa_003356900 [Elysia marginata]